MYLLCGIVYLFAGRRGTVSPHYTRHYQREPGQSLCNEGISTALNFTEHGPLRRIKAESRPGRGCSCRCWS